MAQADGPVDGVVEDDGGAIGEAHRQDTAGLVGDEAIDVADPGAVLGRRHAGDGRAVNEVGVDDGVGVAAEEAIGAPPVGVDAVALVGHGQAQVERVERGQARAAAAREDGVVERAVGQAVEAEGEQVVVGIAFHYAKTGFLRRNPVSKSTPKAARSQIEWRDSAIRAPG